MQPISIHVEMEGYWEHFLDSPPGFTLSYFLPPFLLLPRDNITHMLMLHFLSIIQSSLAAFLLRMHNERSVQQYKETSVKTQHGTDPRRCSDWMKRWKRARERDMCLFSNVLYCDSENRFLDHGILKVFMLSGLCSKLSVLCVGLKRQR